ncbi:MAG TPA: hypothetical protein VLF89_01595 [Candidatus Saccharimonadales bacterium]|nr:hypothetical protein [Candidatus Saccharimonadales bacterium]
MKYLQRIWIKGIIYASIFTIFPYLLAFFLVGWHINDNSGLEIGFFRLIVLFGTPPLWLITTILPVTNDFFFLYVYPVFSFIAWYLIVCTIIYIIYKLRTKKK